MDITQYPTLPQGAEAWTASWVQQFSTWTAVSATGAGRILSDAFAAAPDIASITDDSIKEHVIRPLTRIGFYSAWVSNDGDEVSNDDQRIIDWIKGLIDSTVPEDEIDLADADDVTEPVEETDAMIIAKVFQSQASWGDAYAREGHINETYWNQAKQVVAHQFANWKRGKYLISTPERMVQQFNRRASKEFGWATTNGRYASGIGPILLGVLPILDRIARGEKPLATRPVPPPNREAISGMLSEVGLSVNGDTYYLGIVLHRLARDWRWAAEPPVLDEGFRVRLSHSLADYVANYEVTEEFAKEVHDFMGLLFFGGTLAPVEPQEDVTDADSLIEWMLSEHYKAGQMQHDAIRSGVMDWVDMVRTSPEKVEAEGLGASLRRNVIAFGFTRFTGKVPKRLLDATLQVVFEKHKGEGLTDEQWRARWERRDVAISYVSGRYGEENSLCSVLEKACRELGVDPTRKPKHRVRMTGSGVTIEVEVEAWADNESRLRQSAQERWGRMSEAERAAAVIERHETYVRWDQMNVAR